MGSSRTPRQNRRDGEGVVVHIRRGGLAQAKRYRPRGQTLREAAAARSKDPYRPALRLLEGGRADAKQSRGDDDQVQATARSRTSRRGSATGGAAASRRTSGAAARTGRTTSTARRREKTTTTRSRATRGTATRRAPRRSAGTPRRMVRLRGVGVGRSRARRNPPRLGNPIRRLRFGTVVVLVLFMVLAGRLVVLQLTDASAYAALGLQQRLREIPLPAPRGAILDRSGAVLAHSVDARYVYADPEMVEDPKATAAKLAPVLGIAASRLAPKLERSVRSDGTPVRFVYLARGVSVTIGDRVKELNLPGIGVDHDERRQVPGHDLAANIIGFTSRDGEGLAGIEAQYDEVLRGQQGERVDELGLNGVPIPDGYHHEVSARPGSSIQLTIDRDLQYEAQRLLAAKLQAVRASFGAAVVLDVKTGEVLAMASWPSYDAADPFDAPESSRIDYNTAVVVEPGSTHKPFVIGAALQEGVIRPDSTPVVPPTIRKGGVTYRDSHWHDTRKMTLPGILAHSSNVGVIQIADQLGAERLYEYQRKFGLGSSTGVGLPGEAGGIVQPPDRWSGSSYGSIPIGLGVAVTPLQMAAGYAAIANDGVWRQPTLVRAIVAPDGSVTPTDPGERRRVLSPEVASQLRLAMEAVTTAEDATGLAAAIPGYRVAGKTGTGMRVQDDRYLPGTVTSFVGMAPADAPRFVVGVFAHVPSGAGGDVAAPVFRDLMTAALQHYAVPPTGRKAPTFSIYA